MKMTKGKLAESESYTSSFLVNQTPKEVFDAINNVRGWWSGSIAGVTDMLHAEFVQYYRDVHIAKMKVIELIPGKKLVWLVTDSHFNFTKDETEWKDTTICFDISKKDNQTLLRFTHHGLVPGLECYEICDPAWTDLITRSLYDLVTKGKGHPGLKDNHFNPTRVKRWKVSNNKVLPSKENQQTK